MLNWLLYHIVLLPISWLPLGLIYIIFKPIYWFIYYVLGYRKKVVMSNLQHSFPNKTEAELKQVTKGFYKHLTSILAESIKNLSISESKLRQRMRVENPEVLNRIFDNNQSVILLSSHFQNWEFLITAQNLLFKHQAIGIGTPLTNKYLNKKINAQRARFGMKITNNEEYKSELEQNSSKPTATLVLGDQSPSKAVNAYWTTFLNQVTPFFYGAEIMANQLNSAVVYCSFTQVRRGCYSIKLIEITNQPKLTNYGDIIGRYVSLLESDIIDSPAYWLWSHKRWKIAIPEDLETVKSDHKNRFLKKFR
ncbi:MAG: lysophospholipid acyltransferase family protein [Crocinitomicaceae bacterium]